MWIGITTPLPYLGLALLGAATGAAALVGLGAAAQRRPGAGLDGLFAAWLVGPIALVILHKSVVYDG